LFDIEIEIMYDCMKVMKHHHVWYAIYEYVMWYVYGDIRITMYDIYDIWKCYVIWVSHYIIHDIWISNMIWVSLCVKCDIWACYLMCIHVLWIHVLCIHMLWFVWDGVSSYTYVLYSLVDGECECYLWLCYYIHRRWECEWFNS